MSFSFFLILTKYTSQTPTVNHIIYKIHKSTMSDLNIKIIIVVVTQYKMCKNVLPPRSRVLHGVATYLI